ncbi:MAG: bifunctional folylpolyglutamate synthase/dihydrofolate synthase [Propionibacteriaceae bacterium]|nr:bifunctional folylpolyglutamate synthase/dihydrofolate synthase [Propionibacteriaceae bacterium]
MKTHREIVDSLSARWPEHQVAKGLERISALTELLGSPQQGYPVIQIAGTNGKGSTAIMIDSILRACGLRVGRFTSPHLEKINERIHIDGEPITDEAFDALVADVMPLVEMAEAKCGDGTLLTFYEVMVGLGFEAFAQAGVDVAVIEVGMGGAWDATNVADAQVAVICPIAFDHTHLLGSTLAEIAGEKAGIIKAGARAVFAQQHPEAAKVLLGRAAQCGVKAVLEGIDFKLMKRLPAAGGQLISIDSISGAMNDLFLPLFGEHMANNAALATAAVAEFLGGRPLADEVVAEGLLQAKIPARLEVVRRSPTIVLDTCHNPHGALATMGGMAEAFAFTQLIGIVAMMRDKDVDAVLEIFSDQMAEVVVTGMKSTNRALTPEELSEKAQAYFDSDRIHATADMEAAIDEAVRLADAAGVGAGILIAGSVYAAGEARTLLGAREDDDQARIPEQPW